jgi:hypothetical protein
MLLDNLTVDLGIVLTAVADENEGQLTIERQHLVDQLALMVLRLARQRTGPGDTPFAQEQDWANGDAIPIEELLQHLVDAPGRS